MVDDPNLIAILGSLNESDGDDTLGDMRHGLDNLEALTDPQLASLICCKEGIAKMKDRIVVEDPVMRAMFISRLGKVIVRTLLVVGSESFDIEGYVRVESRTESRRMVEDFLDMATDVMKSFALGALGKAPAVDSSQVFPDSVECCNAYCEVLTLLLASYNSAFEPLDAWTDALTGVAGSGSLGVHTASRVAVRSSALSLLPVLKPALAIVLRDRYQLMSRCRQLPSYSYAPLRLVSAFMRTLLTDVSYTASILTVLNSAESESGAGQNIFGSGGSGDSLEGTRLSGPSLPIQPYIAEWVDTVLIALVVEHVVSGEDTAVVELSAVLKDVICLTQHRIMATTRQQVAGPVLQKLFYLLENYAALSTQHDTVPTYAELSSWALLMLRYTAHMDTIGNSGGQEGAGSDKSAHNSSNSKNPPGKPEFVTYHYHLRLFKILCEITDVVTQTRFFAEFCMLLLHRAMHEELDLALNAPEEWERFSASRTGYKFTVTLPSAILRSLPVRQLLESGTRTAPNAVLARFVTALCDTYHTLLQYTLTPVLVLWPEVLRAGGAGAQSAQKGKTTEKVTDFLDFAPTTAATAGTTGNTGVAAAQCDPQYLPTLQAHLDGTQELLHPWSMLHDQLCTSGVKRACSAIHTLLYPAAVDARITPGPALDAKTVAVRVKAEYAKLMEILVRLLEGSVFAIKTFEHCFKWPLGEGSDQHAHAYYKSDSAQQALITLVHLVAKLLNTSHTTGLFNFSSTGSTAATSAFGANDGFFATGASKASSATVVTATTTAELLKQLSPLTAKYNDTVVKLRTELAYVLHLALEWVAQDYSKVQNASYVRQFLVTMIVHRLTLPASGGDANFGGTTDADALGTADLMLKHIKAMMYNTAAHQEYLLTLQAKSMQGVLGAGHHARYDGAASTLASQLQALELLNLLAHQHASNGPVLQLVVQLLRQIERDYLWSEALETKSAFSCTVDDSLYQDTWTTPAGVQITKLPVSPVLKEHISLTLRSALPLVPATATSKVWTAPLYTVQEIRAFLREGTDLSHVLAQNDLDFGPVSAASSTTTPAAAAAVSNDGFAPTIATFSATHSKADALFEVPALSHSNSQQQGTKITVTEAALALLEYYRINSSAHIADTSDYNQVRGLFSPLNTAYTSSAIPASAYVCHADLLAQIADVQQSHLHCQGSDAHAPHNRTQANLSLVLPAATSDNVHTADKANLKAPTAHGTHGAEYEQSLLSTAMLPPRDKFWTQLSGSADLLTVLAYSDIDLHTMTASIHVRVFNSSGFKIPTFALHLVAAGNLLAVDHSRGLASHTVALGSTITGNAASVVHQTQQHLLHSAGQGYSVPGQSIYFDESCVLSASGVDFFLPDAYIEHTLTCKVRNFAPFEAVVRIVYADLVYDEDNIFEIPKELTANAGTARSGAQNKASALKKNKSANANASSRGPRYMEEYKEKHSNKWSAVLDCEPLRVPISAQLLPYGYGTYSALRYWYNQHQSNHGRTIIAELQTPGIPEAVFQNQWRRLGGRFECSAPIVGYLYLPQHPAAPSAGALSGGHTAAGHTEQYRDSAFLAAQVNAQLEVAIRSAISTYGGTGMHLLGMDGKVCSDGLTSQRYTLRSYCDPALTSAAALGTASSRNHAFNAYSAWSLQTAQGAEVSIKIIIDTPAVSANRDTNNNNASTTTAVSMFDAMSLDALNPAFDNTGVGEAGNAIEWTGRVVVRCSDHATLQAVLSDLELFLYALTGGFVGLAEAV